MRLPLSIAVRAERRNDRGDIVTHQPNRSGSDGEAGLGGIGGRPGPDLDTGRLHFGDDGGIEIGEMMLDNTGAGAPGLGNQIGRNRRAAFGQAIGRSAKT